MVKVELKAEAISNIFQGKTPLIRLVLEVTRNCNLRCLHCAPSAGKSLMNELTTAEIFKLIDDATELGLLNFQITGGEPLMRRDIFQILKYADSKDFGIALNTNGTLLDEQKVSALEELNNLRLVAVSLDGVTPEKNDFFRGVKGSYRRAVEGIKLLVERKIPTSINSVLWKEAICDIPEMFELTQKLKVKALRFILFACVGRGMSARHLSLKFEEFVKALEKIQESSRELENDLFAYATLPPALTPYDVVKKWGFSTGCTCGVISCDVQADGKVFPCLSFNYIGAQGFEAGNLRESSLKEIWVNSRVLRKIRSIYDKELKGVCNKCKFKLECFGFCRADAYMKYNDLLAPLPLCQEFYEHKMFRKEYICEQRS